MGQCIRLDVTDFANITGKDKLLIQFHLNKSDATVTSRDGHGLNFLTNGAINGITVYPVHGIDNVILHQQENFEI